MKNIEIEIQVQVEKIQPLKDFLKAKAKKVGENRQIDEYFCPAHRDFLSKRPAVEWLRLRDSSGKFSINYKNWHHDEDGKGHHCDEYESEIKDISQLQLIFKALNIKPIVKVDKKRTIYLYEDYEVSIDQVQGLGDFVEIEYKGESDGSYAKEITDQMVSFLKNLNVGTIYRNYAGYPFQLLFPKETKIEKY